MASTEEQIQLAIDMEEADGKTPIYGFNLPSKNNHVLVRHINYNTQLIESLLHDFSAALESKADINNPTFMGGASIQFTSNGPVLKIATEQYVLQQLVVEEIK